MYWCWCPGYIKIKRIKIKIEIKVLVGYVLLSVPSYIKGGSSLVFLTSANSIISLSQKKKKANFLCSLGLSKFKMLSAGVARNIVGIIGQCYYNSIYTYKYIYIYTHCSETLASYGAYLY